MAIIQHGNGGAEFAFAKPFKITAEDIASRAAFKLDLTFNPDGIIKGANGPGGRIWGDVGTFSGFTTGCTTTSGPTHPSTYPNVASSIVDGTNVYGIDVPMLGLTPIAHRADDPVIREQYLFHHITASGQTAANDPKFDVRVELYSLQSDPTRTVYGVSIEPLFIAGEHYGMGTVGKTKWVTVDANG
jgi:hypothetical protein